MSEINPGDDERRAFGVRLATARVAAGLTQAELAKGLGPDGRDLQKAAVSAWEVGTSTPNTDQLRVICERLRISADRLLDISAKRAPKAQSSTEKEC